MKKWRIISIQSQKVPKEIKTVEKILLKNRGFDKDEEVRDFFNPDISDLNIINAGIDKKEFQKFKKRLQSAFNNNEKIIIFGDFDVDGICASAILWEAIYKSYKNIFPYIPDRIEEGYGLSEKGIDKVLEIHPDTKVIITVDNGIVAFKAVDYANSKGIDVVVTDHHVKEKKLPKASIILHTTKLCGAGIAWVIINKLGYLSDGKIHELLELACLATVADLVPLTYYNRAIVSEGITLLRKTERIGLMQLIYEAGIDPSKITTYSISHIIAPRLNASGRIQSAMNALRLLCTNDRNKAEELSLMLSKLNKNRQELTEESVSHAKLLAIGKKEEVIIVASKKYSQGVIGLIASNLVEAYYKPVLAISLDEPISKGSARSIRGINIIELIRSTGEVLENAGGHPMAAGFSVRTELIEEFSKRIIKNSKKYITKDTLERYLDIDCMLSFELINPDLIKTLNKFEPFGMGNPQPVFATRNVSVLECRKIGKDQNHLKLKVESEGSIIDAVAFGFGDKVEFNEGDKIDIAYAVGENEWNGKISIQLRIKDIVSNQL